MRGSAELSYINVFRRFYRRTLRRLLRRWFWRKHRHVTVRICHFKSLGESVGNLNGETGHITVRALYGLSFWIRRKKKPAKTSTSATRFFFKFKNFSVRNSVGHYRLNYRRKVAVGNFDLKIPTKIFRW